MLWGGLICLCVIAVVVIMIDRYEYCQDHVTYPENSFNDGNEYIRDCFHVAPFQNSNKQWY